MLSMKFDVKKVQSTLQDNREKHRLAYEEMVADFKGKMTDILNGKLIKLKAGEMVSPTITLESPFNYLEEYDQALHMLSNTTDTNVTLADHEYSRYMLDNWPAKHRFLNTSQSYKR